MSKPTWWLWLAVVSSVGCPSLYAQVPAPAAQGEPAVAPEPQESRDGKRRRPGSPYEAYDAGHFEEALQGFVDLQVERPDDPEVALNVGSTQYQMRNFPEADRTFSKAAMAPDSGVRGQALYNLGNSAYRQGRLQEAVELYKSVLELDPDDEDAKFNLEFVRDEIRRRHEEAQKRQQEQQQQEQQDQQQQNESQDQSQESGQQEQEGQPEGEEEQQGGQEGQQQQPESAQDSDQDGLSDQQEQSAENPTDPKDADSDDDGLPDGAEDLNRNGRVDPEETDPNRADTDGDGVPDSQETPGDGAGSVEPESFEGLTPEEAERYLQALQEGRPNRQHAGRGRRVKGDKDW
jgi:Ca-activated chloride channel family protein